MIFQDPYAFIEFANNSAAAQALVTLNHRRCLEKEMKVNWATSNGHGGPAQGGAPTGGGAGGGAGPGPKVDTSSHHHIFVGDLRSAHSRFFTPLFYGYEKKLAISLKFSESGRNKEKKFSNHTAALCYHCFVFVSARSDKMQQKGKLLLKNKSSALLSTASALGGRQ